MKLKVKTPINIISNDIPTDDGKIEIDYSTQSILKSFLTEYRIEPEHWQQIIAAWYKDQPSLVIG